MDEINVSQPNRTLSKEELLKQLQLELDIVGYSINCNNEIIHYEWIGPNTYDYVVVDESKISKRKAQCIRTFHLLLLEL